MKKFRLLFVVSALLLTMVPQAMAEIKAQSFSVSPYLGGYSFLGRERLETGPTLGVRGGYNLTRHFGLEAALGYISTEGKKNSGIGDSVDAWNLHLDMLYHFLPDGPLVPYLAAGYGGHWRDYDDRGEVDRSAFNYGLGAKFFLSEAMALRGDLRHFVMRDQDDTFHNLEYSVGVDFLFGGVKPAVAAAAPPAAAPLAPPAEEPPLEPVPAAEPEPGRFKYCVTLQGEFDIDKAEIRPEYKDEIAAVGNFMKKYPTTTAVIEGYTDNVGDPDHNLDLSKRRAEAVVNHLVENYGIERSRLEARGLGMARPIASNATEEGKQANRRIEAIIDCAFDVKEVQPPERLCMTLMLDFESGKAEIKPQYRDEMAKVGEYMQKYPTTTAVIEGHTDNVGGFDYNMKLSQARADNAVRYLVENFKIEKSRLAAKGYGYTRRVAYNSTPEGRARNRRINAIIDCVVKP